VLEIADAGCGMDPATRDRLFEPFFSTKAEVRGLAIPGEQFYLDDSVARLESELKLDPTELEYTSDRAYTRFEKMRAALG
jgi:nitrogen-specific signal transduction histidine kinase